MHVGSRLPTDVSEFNSDVVNSCGIIWSGLVWHYVKTQHFFIATAFRDLCACARECVLCQQYFTYTQFIGKYNVQTRLTSFAFVLSPSMNVCDSFCSEFRVLTFHRSHVTKLEPRSTLLLCHRQMKHRIISVWKKWRKENNSVSEKAELCSPFVVCVRVYVCASALFLCADSKDNEITNYGVRDVESKRLIEY